MCGITGIYSKVPISNIKERIEKMNLSIGHRGPDAEGILKKNEKIALGHKRLSIIDISNEANQPMTSNSGRWNIVFNGEIYNFKEIASEINYNFKTHSDTEVILGAIEEKGIDWFLERANGMFAIGLYDNQEEKLFLVRDRLGIKPLFFYRSNSNIIFSSEIKGILNSGLVEAIFNENAVDEYLANRYVRSPYTFFKNIYQVEPATYLIVDNNINVKERKFWVIPEDFNTESKYNEEEILDEFESELVKAIKYRLISDVPLGTYLSGGVDSSLITAITAIEKGTGVNTYTIGFPELNEFKYSKIIADKYGTSHHEIVVNKEDYIINWERLIKYKDAPLGVPNEIPLALMSNKLKEKITVVLSGEGADELLGGYGRIFRSPFEYENIPLGNENFYDFFIKKYEYVPRALRNEYLIFPQGYRDLFDNLISNEFLSTSREQSVFKFFHKYHIRGLLQRVDMTTMQTAVEARVPFLDHNLIEFSYKKIPYDLKLNWKGLAEKEKARKQSSDEFSEYLDTPKYLLKRLSYKYLPKEIIERKKVGFPVPLTDWFSELENMAIDLLQETVWLKKGVVNELVGKSKKENRAGQILWMFINIELFRKNYFNQEWRW